MGRVEAQAGFLHQLAPGRVHHRFSGQDETARQGLFPLVGGDAPLDQGHLQAGVRDGEHDDVDGDGHDGKLHAPRLTSA